METNEPHPEHWRSNLRVTAMLLALWFGVTFVVGWFARDLSFTFFGWSFSYWMGAQGALLVYVAITWFYASYMDRLDRRHALAQDPFSPEFPIAGGAGLRSQSFQQRRHAHGNSSSR